MSKDLQPTLARLHETSMALQELSSSEMPGSQSFYLYRMPLRSESNFQDAKIYFSLTKPERLNLSLIGLRPESRGASLTIGRHANLVYLALLRPQMGNWRASLPDLNLFLLKESMLQRLQHNIEELLVETVLRDRKNAGLTRTLQAVSD